MSPMAGRQRGIGKFEFSVLVAMLGILALALIVRLQGVEEEAERLEVALTVRNIGVGLQWAIGERLMHGEEHRLAELLEANPVALLGHAPRRYGEAPGGAGSWWFDPETRTLGYRPRQPHAFGGKTVLYWRIGARGMLGGRVVGLRLMPVEAN
ncbi:hypothetical protein [Denitratisoma sp. DHT3]|uniref:hypothetical protein n=1 Tax=Denitratisoma sp. DHT3 TaxID=1981880 RepID=UPI0011A7601F|nr:hypothetical protein [Denitratisoma sp. DHT3]